MLHGGPHDGKAAVAYGVTVGGVIRIERASYRVTALEDVPGRNDMLASATFVKPLKAKTV